MKKILLILAVLMINTSLTMAQKGSDAQTIRQKVAEFANKKGYQTQITEENALTLQKDTCNYIIFFSGSNPTYVELRPYDFDITQSNYLCITKAINQVNINFGVIKAMITPDRESLRLSAEMNVFDASGVTQNMEHYFVLFGEAWRTINYRYYEFYENKDINNNRMPFEVYCIDIANTDSNVTVIGETNGEIKASEAQYIHIGLNLIGYEVGEYPISVKLVLPDGTYAADKIDNQYTFTANATITKGSKFYDLGRWGSTEAGYWVPGAYRYELYYKDRLFYVRTFLLK